MSILNLYRNHTAKYEACYTAYRDYMADQTEEKHTSWLEAARISQAASERYHAAEYEVSQK